MNRVQRLRIAVICALTQWGLMVFLQMRSYFGFVLPPSSWTFETGTAFFNVIPFIQAQNALVACVFGLVTYFAARSRRLVWIFFAVYCTASAYLLVDQVYYKVFRDHIQMDMVEGGQEFNALITFSSFVSELDRFFFFAAAFAIAGAAWFARALIVPPEHPRNLRRIFIVAALLALVGIPAFFSAHYGHVNDHPLVTLVRELGQRNVESILAERTIKAQRRISLAPENSALSNIPISEDQDPRLSALLAASHPRNPRPNVILFVLESVGSLNLLGADQRPLARVAPTLARLAQNGVVFNSLYTSFPGTTRSLVSLHTGGRQLTYGGIAEFDYPYDGPLLPAILTKNGYATALFSSERLDGEGTNVFLSKAGFQKFYDVARDHPGRAPANRISSWGSRDEFVLPKVEDWISSVPKGSPFYVEYITVATHHPYTIPSDYHAPLMPHDLQSQYVNAINYTDHGIQTLLDFLAQRGELENTIIAVTGDHGEAFGDLHANNFVHKERIYDENIREFLLLWDGQLAARKLVPATIVSRRMGANADIMPTLLALLDLPPVDVPGRNLLTEHFENRPVYFHKLASPESWGVRDGRWKYIGEIRNDVDELYNLASDPAESHNLARMFPDRVRTYRAMCQRWYLQSEHDYSARLEDYPSVDSKIESGDTKLGARTLDVGLRTGRHSFVQVSQIAPKQPVVAWTKWAIDPDLLSRYEWIAPSGRIFISQPLDAGQFNTTYTPFPGASPLEEGSWAVQLREKGYVRMTAHFSVSRNAKVQYPER